MADNRVEVRVGARTSELEQGMNDAEQIVENAADNMEDTGRNIDFVPDFSNFRSSIDSISQLVTTRFEEVGTSISASFTRSFAMVGLGITAAVGTAMIGLANLTNQVGEASKELENQSRLANATTTEFQEWAFAAKKVSVEQDKLSDVMKDVNDKFGDFMQTGGGEMADFFEKIAPKVGVTAKEFQGLSGPQILEKYYQTLQKANVSQAEMTFYMESLADDATLLAPLLENNSDKLKDFSQQAHDLGLVMDEQAIRATKEFSSSLGIIQATMQGVLNNMAAQAAPILTDLANKFLDFAARSKEGIDGSVTAIITIFENLLGIVQSVFTLISDIWNDLTADIGDGAISQISFMDSVSGAMKGFAAVAVGLRVSIEIAFAAIRAVVSTVCQAINIAINTVLNVFGGFRDTIQFGLDILSVKFQAFGNVVSNVLSFNFSGAKASWESGLSQIGSITDRYSTKMRDRAFEVRYAWNTGVSNTANAWGSAGAAIVNSATKGNEQLKNLFLKNQTQTTVAPPPPPPTFNPNFGIGTGVKNAGGSSAKAKADADAKAKQRAADQAAKTLADIRYKYATEEEKIARDLQKALSEIEKSKATDAEKGKFRIVAEKEASDKTIALRVKEFDEVKKLHEQRIENDQQSAQRRYEIEKAQIQAAFDAKKISNVQKFQLEKELEDQLRELKRRGLEERLELENQMSTKSGKQGNQDQILNNISNLDTDQKVSDTKSIGLIKDSEMKDFEDKFGGLTSRMSNLWDQGIQAMMNGTLTWRNATNAVLTDMAGFFIQKMVTEPLKLYMAGLAQRLAIRLGFIKTETVSESMGQAAQTGATIAGEAARTSATGSGVLARLAIRSFETIKSIMISAWQAMAQALASVPPPWNIALGGIAFAGVAALAGKVASARGGYDIPAGVNPMTQLHEEEMVLPRQHANTIRALGKTVMGDGSLSQTASTASGDSGSMPPINIQAWDTKDIKRFMKKHGRDLAGGLKGYNRNFGK
ncbi:phage tail protein [Acinetobacter beijerinckii]|uniref:phage tail protein n=1 Tax=Acinetobacter beijerinckii TaxID=262668 RepID=UPI0023DDF2B7|nr:phage tail protein [Acinetobacter beijerinckii]MDF2418483.1 phage tail protein [Acinetobacter beijerinckii]